jgi:hypothetical protein
MRCGQKPTEVATVTYTVTVVSDGGNKYRIDGSSSNALTLNLTEGIVYLFQQSDASNCWAPFAVFNNK